MSDMKNITYKIRNASQFAEKWATEWVKWVKE
jgi:hypothetical protein